MAARNTSHAEAQSTYIAQSIFAQSPAAVGLDLSTEVIVCEPCDDISEYQGTCAALEAEGVLPAGADWPKGFDRLSWDDDKFRYFLYRAIPQGVKGTRKQFLDIDWWKFRCVSKTDWGVRKVEQKRKELADEIYHQSPKGLVEKSKQWGAYFKAQRDEKFQAFKTLIPGINRPKRGRRPKSATQPRGEAA